MRKISCFIACAFGKQDIDNLFIKAIKPTLKELDIIPCRVDLLEHNEDIDDKIIELIKTCDICIADLTYARPSVYYESGYFSGLGKPVIYSARKDHFIPSEKDIYGNFKVHFDLQMKNIIEWPSITKLKNYKNRLHSRVKLIIKPINKQIKQNEELIKEQLLFTMLSPVDKLKKIADEYSKTLKENIWRVDTLKSHYHKDIKYFSKGKKVIILVLSQSATKDVFKYNSPFNMRYDLNRESERDADIHIIYLSLRKIPISRIDDAFETATPIKAGEIVQLSKREITTPMPIFKQTTMYCHFISNGKSMNEYNQIFKNHYDFIMSNLL